MTLSHMLKRLVIVEVHCNQQELFLMVVRNIRLVLDMCELLLSSMIVGALEFNRGSMQVEYIHPSNPAVVQTIYVYTNDYIDCFKQVFTE